MSPVVFGQLRTLPILLCGNGLFTLEWATHFYMTLSNKPDKVESVALQWGREWLVKIPFFWSKWNKLHLIKDDVRRSPSLLLCCLTQAALLFMSCYSITGQTIASIWEKLTVTLPNTDVVGGFLLTCLPHLIPVICHIWPFAEAVWSRTLLERCCKSCSK